MEHEHSLSKRRRLNSKADEVDSCDRCQRMTSSKEGLEGLFSSSGYLHYTRREMEESASRGCNLCAAIMQKSSKWGRSQHLMLFAARDYREVFRSIPPDDNREYSVRPFDEILGCDPAGRTKIRLHVFTSSGMYSMLDGSRSAC